MMVKSFRIRFLESWARNLPTRNNEEVKHAVEVFAQARFGVSRWTAREYAREVLRLLIKGEDKELMNLSHCERRMYRENLNPTIKPKKRRIVTLRIDDREYRKLKALARKKRIDVSTLIRHCIREVMKQNVLH